MLFDVYGTSETKEIAWECEAGSRHINADVVYVEILDEQGAVVPTGADGEIVVTLLVNRAMPLVRYRTGDRGSMLPSRCSCGRGSPLLGVISGRDSDTLELPDGSTRSPYQLTMALELVPELAQYQIVQVQRDLLRVSAVAIAHTRHDVSTLEREIHDALREVLPRDVFVEVTIVERLARGPREKLRAVHPLPRSHESLAALATIPGALE
jgi:phenylacetate-CoA ligase